MSDKREDDTLPASLRDAVGFVEIASFDSEAGRIRVEFDARESFLHSGGVIQGGFVTAWIDSAMAFVVHRTSNYELTPLTLELKISFFDAALPGKVFAEAWIERQGKSIAFLEGHLLSEAGKVIAKGSSSVKLFKR